MTKLTNKSGLVRSVVFAFMATVMTMTLTSCNNPAVEAVKTDEAAPKTTTTQMAKTDDTKMAVDDMTLYLDLKDGRVTIKLRPDLAPKHAAQITALVKKGFYDGIVFHRVIDGFMAQTGDPTGTGRGGSDMPDIPAEFSAEPFKRGIVGMARSQNPDSANSQFFIMFADGEFLNNQYTVIGQVVEGMDLVDKIKKGEGQNGEVSSPDKIIKMQMASDAS